MTAGRFEGRSPRGPAFVAEPGGAEEASEDLDRLTLRAAIDFEEVEVGGIVGASGGRAFSRFFLLVLVAVVVAVVAVLLLLLLLLLAVLLLETALR